MKFNYYPGCSLHGAAVDYQMSIDKVAEVIKMELQDVDDWNCCGATATPSEDQKLSLLLSARNLAKCSENDRDLAVSCNACYLRLKQLATKFEKYPEQKETILKILEEQGLSTNLEKVKVRHLLQILLEDVGLGRIKSLVEKPLSEVKVVPYYGCLLVRPEGFDDPEQPTSLDELLEALGAEVLPFYKKTKCCGNAVVNTNEDAALKMIKEILEEADKRGSQAIIVTCPVCQFNLDAFQSKVNQKFGTSYSLPVIYFTQLMGLAFGISPQELGIDRGIVSRDKLMNAVRGVG